MDKKAIRKWCIIATVQIRFPPDRKVVYAELEQHMHDHYDALIEQGISPEDATEMTLEAMGNASEVAKQLAAIHRPFWGYALRVCRIALIVMLCLSLLPILNYYSGLYLRERPSLQDFNIYSSASYGGDTGRTLHHLSKPNKSFSTDGSTFTITNAAVYTEYSTYYERDRTYLYVLIQQTSLLPWTEHDAHLPFFAVTAWFTARDSLGNTYEGYLDQSSPDAPTLNTSGVQSGIFTYTHECWINDFPADAEWVEIGYQRDGRNYMLRIYLTGGNSK